MDISSVDKNFKIETKIKKDDIKFYNIENEPFKTYGVYKDDGMYRRMPADVAKSVSEGVYRLHTNASGGRVRFVTDSPYVAVHALVGGYAPAPNFSVSGIASFDIYAGTLYMGTVLPPVASKGEFEGVVDFYSAEEREITVNFPSYCDVKEVYIGLAEGSSVKEPSPYMNEKPIVYYGSSITQGASSSRPGMIYENILSRRFNCDYVSLGFGGNAKAEDSMAEYVKNLDMSVFVYDYDHNAPNADYLEATHEKMFKTVRTANPDLPIIFMSRPRFRLVVEDERRRSIVETTYKNALAAGDKNVYFLDGKALSALCGCDGMVEGTHPNDFGFVSMAKALGDVLEEIFRKKEWI
ncbi:MAG: hypothetical protein IKU61_00010 [Clostridia bacterium]|nr:hypothetical protein [Clostridia bacterium]